MIETSRPCPKGGNMLEEIEKEWKNNWTYHAPVYIDWLISRGK